MRGEGGERGEVRLVNSCFARPSAVLLFLSAVFARTPTVTVTHCSVHLLESAAQFNISLVWINWTAVFSGHLTCRAGSNLLSVAIVPKLKAGSEFLNLKIIPTFK